MKWTFLVVDDEEIIANQTVETLSGIRTLGPDDEIACDFILNFEDAKSHALKVKYDLVVLDLKDDARDVEGADYKGQEVLEFLRQTHFVPVIFYTGHPHKVKHLESPMVRVVAKGDDDVKLLRTAVVEVFETRLPHLIKHIQDQQREYLWGHIDEFWRSGNDAFRKEELAFLLARRLGNVLAGDSIRRFLRGNDANPDIVHPVEMYMWPSIGDDIQTGDIITWQDAHFVVMNPACDFAQGKIEFVVLVRCLPLEDSQEYAKSKLAKSQGATELRHLTALVRDRREKVQPERFKYLPGTCFIPDLVADFQMISTVSLEELSASAKRVATLDTPFAEGLVSGFSRYYGRIGVPNLDSKELAVMIFEGIKI
ncbi:MULTISPECIES: response regulator [unclassified Pseudomonas]|uniref:response regulator n=1 Tax=unclassified Pseudomonas TaxID=196821 RepID=UPI001CBB8E0F|nr:MULTISPECIES: response regulator [unclassified Pseudomonas]